MPCVQACSAMEAATASKIDNLNKAMAGLSASVARSVEGVTETMSKNIHGLSRWVSQGKLSAFPGEHMTEAQRSTSSEVIGTDVDLCLWFDF